MSRSRSGCRKSTCPRWPAQKRQKPEELFATAFPWQPLRFTGFHRRVTEISESSGKSFAPVCASVSRLVFPVGTGKAHEGRQFLKCLTRVDGLCRKFGPAAQVLGFPGRD